MRHTKITNIEIFVLTALVSLSLVTGYCFKDIFIGFGANFFNNFIHSLPASYNSLESEFLSMEVKIMPLLLTVLAFELESRFFECKWFYNEVVNSYLTLPALVLSRHLFEQHEKIILEQNGPLFFVNLVVSSSTRYFIK